MDKTKYAFFDFDGTLVSHDTFQLLIRYSLKTSPQRFFIILFLAPLLLPLLLATYIFKFDKRFAKSAILWSLTVGKTKRQSIVFLRLFSEQIATKIWFHEATPLLSELLKKNYKIFVVTASGQLWVRLILQKQFPRIHGLIGTKLAYSHLLKGLIVTSKNCYDKEKIKCLREKIDLTQIDWVASYTDHTADLPLLEKAKEKHIINPKAKHLAIFQDRFASSMNLHQWNSDLLQERKSKK